MRIKKIDIDGFKSYAQRQTIVGFDPQFNAITGLNGSGKSNILDSICFVLGISNLSQVRALSLADLVYKHGQAGITKATVTITFDNSNPDLRPLGYEDCKEIVVRRQVIVNGRNNYTINGYPATNQRAADLFRSVGLNINNPHFLIMQGRITKVLNMKPMEILGMIEEAAGVRLLDAKKLNCQKTIEKKDTTMAEIRRVMTEDIEPKIATLKDDKKNYVEFEKLTRDNEILNRRVVAAEYVECEENRNILLQKKEPLLEEIKQISATIEANNERIEEVARRQQEVDLERAKMQQEVLGGLQDKVQETAKYYTTMQAEKKEKTENIKGIETSINRKHKDIESDQKYLDQKKKELEKTEEQLGGEQQKGEDAEEAVNLARKKIETLAKGMMLDDQGQAVTLEGQLTATRTAISEAETKIKTSEMRLKQIEPMLTKKQKELSAFSSEEKSANEEMVKLEKHLTDAQKSLDSVSYTEGTWEQIDDERRNLVNERRQVAHDYDSLESRHQNLAGNYRDPYPNFDRNKVKGTIAKLIRVKDMKYATALEVVAGGSFSNLVVEDAETAKELLKRSCLQRRTTIMPLDKLVNRDVQRNKISAAQRVVGNKGEVCLAYDLIEFDREVEPAIRNVFANTLVCSDMNTAKTVAFHRDVQMRCVTLEGEDYRPSGTLTGGSRQNKTSVLTDLETLRTLEERIAEMDDRGRHLEEALRDAANQQARYNQAKSNFTAMQGRLESLRERMKTSRVQMLKNDIEQLEAEIPSCRAERDEAKSKVAELKAKLTDLERNKKNEKEFREREKKNAQKDLKEAEERFKNMRTAYENARVTLDTLRNEVAQCEKELEAGAEELKKLNEDLTAAKEQFEIFVEQLEEAKKSSAEAKKEHEEIMSGFRQMEVKMREFNKESDQLRKKNAELRQKTEALEDEAKRITEQAELWLKKRVSLEKKNPWIEEDKAYFGRSDSRYDFGGMKFDELRKEYDRRQERIEALKKIVKPQAMQTLSLAEEHHAALQKQIEMLQRDREKLRKALVTMDTRKENEILRAHRQINLDFGSIYSTLLPGATAKLDPPSGFKNALGGLEVKVAFNNKWKESLQELSGGQRSLVALSLVLAMLKFSPAPLYILDEVDAALDMSHTQNIGRMIKEHFNQSQFVVVSLKEGMFNHANVLFRTKFVDGTSTVVRTTNVA
ncbi:hypothetical protein L596_028965 [Steinernema carpocapsae]|uniref:Structural maintenance of chromosomes protein n=1 Tax=Steinernema carpocapsae TaxID=34508 RepID=A0A4U5LT75_STECR|nr:hypothetical protein L596_028965 [Steinernema carpocapsae]